MTSQKPSIDHIIILVPYSHLLDPPAWLTDNFTISPGGRHADDRTENRLITLDDGSYIELIAFVDDAGAARRGHWWDKPFGIVDYCLTDASAGPDLTALNGRLARAAGGVSYDAPREGGRTRPDGVDVRWRVTFPAGVERGIVPFWCHDVTARERRAPAAAASKGAGHACGALRVAGVEVEVGRERVAAVDAAVAAVVGAEGGARRYDVGAVRGVEGLRPPYVAVREAEAEGAAPSRTLVLQVARADLPRDIVQRVGDGEVRIRFERA